MSDARLEWARELHDRLGQQIAALTLLLGRLEPCVETVDGQVHLARLGLQVDSLNDEFRRLLSDLHAPQPPQDDMEDTMTALIRRWRDMAGIEVSFVTQGTSKGITLEEQLVVVRVVQEALTNIVKHAPTANRVAVTLTFSQRQLIVAVADDGPGFVLERKSSRSASDRGYGLDGMRDRLRRMGGTLTIQAAPGRGVTVRGRLPLTSAEL